MSERLLSFPNPVNEVAARVTAGGVVVLGVVLLASQAQWLAVAMAIGFFLRVLAGPKLSPLALLSVKVIVPRLPFEKKMVAGPPKRFAQTIGLVFTTVASLLFFVVPGGDAAGYVMISFLIVAAGLESFVGFCLGCQAFALLMRVGVVPAEVCESCNDIWAGRERPTVAS